VGIWVRMENGKLRSGLCSEARQRVNYSGLIALTGEGCDHPNGILCQATDSASLFWMPLSEFTWTKVSVDLANLILETADLPAAAVVNDIVKRMTMQGLIVTLMPELRFGEL
jgi:hypothetical protein